LSVMVWNYEDNETAARPASVELVWENLPARAEPLRIHHYRIDETHSNAFTAWKNMGAPQAPTPLQYSKLEESGKLQEIPPPRFTALSTSELRMTFELPWHAVSLLQVGW